MVELNTDLLVEMGGWPALKEARGLVAAGKVREVRRETAVIRGRVQGGEKIYDTQITLGQRISDVEAKCTCLESRRSGRVCAHILATGLAALQPPSVTPPPVVAKNVSADLSQASATISRHPRWLAGEAPPGTPLLELSLLLPLQLSEGLARDPVRVILEARRDPETVAQPWETALRSVPNGFAVGEDDEQLLAALERSAGGVRGINAIPPSRIGSFLHALAEHPRVWLGKKQRIEIVACRERPKIVVRPHANGDLELAAPPDSPRPAGTPLPVPGWFWDGTTLRETTASQHDFAAGKKLIPHARIPDFLTTEWPALEQTADLEFSSGFEGFLLEQAQPRIEVRLEGALAGLTLELFACYGDEKFLVPEKLPQAARPAYLPDPRQSRRFWSRDFRVEQAARAEAERAGFKPARGGNGILTLTHENQVAHFLANVLPRWRRRWDLSFGSRLTGVLQQVDVVEPEFSLRGASGEDWLSLDLKLSAGGKPVPLDSAEIQRWLQTGRTHAKLPNQRVLLVPTEAWAEMREIVSDCAVEQTPGTMRVSRIQAPFLAEALSAQGFVSRRNDAANIALPDVKPALDAALLAQLRPYQLEGVTWLASLARRGLNGLLADEMGLGKTLQALAFCAWLRREKGEGSLPALVVCPTSLVTNWRREAAKFTPHLRTLDLTGSDRQGRIAARQKADLLVTSYALLRRDLEIYRADSFSLVILDEAQHIKNRASQNAQAAKMLRAERRLILTGTPLENSVLDLWSLYDFLLPGYLGTAADFRERYEKPLAGGGSSSREMERLRHRVRPFFLRRKKEEVVRELPAKLEYLTLCELTGEQREVYRAILAQGRRDVFEQAGKTGRGRDRIAVLTALLRLRQVCCHLDLLPQGDTRRAWREPSAKMERAFELIDEAADGGHRVLVFSQFTRMLHLLRDEAVRREWRYCYLDGQTVERQAEVDRFQADSGIPIFFISLKAGGTGLNLTGADTVLHFDPWWNPAVEEQATARAHRIGQTRDVQAYKLIAAGTVEEKIQALQARKRELFQASLGDEALVESLTGDELEELLAE